MCKLFFFCFLFFLFIYLNHYSSWHMIHDTWYVILDWIRGTSCPAWLWSDPRLSCTILYFRNSAFLCFALPLVVAICESHNASAMSSSSTVFTPWFWADRLLAYSRWWRAGVLICTGGPCSFGLLLPKASAFWGPCSWQVRPWPVPSPGVPWKHLKNQMNWMI